jgi:SAM-dependent methyltransferase
LVINDSAESPGDDLLWRHLKSVPAFRALLRSTEARLFQQVEIQSPSLDLGCGDGHFANIGLNQRISVGIDPWWGPLTKAVRTHAYAHLIQGYGDNLPFTSSFFRSVISNSVLEHIPTLQPVINEIYRVLQPGGRLFFSTPSDQFTERLFGAKWLERIGMSFGANWYRKFFNGISRHYHTDPPDIWLKRLNAAGFEDVTWRYYFSEKALHALEFGHFQGLPSAVIHAITGHWIVAPWRSSLAPTERWIRPLYEEDYPEVGTMMFFVATKHASA